jgi:uncharacterized protein (TIGR03437 family)
MTMDVIETGDDNCDDNIEAEVTLTAASGDKFNLRLFVPSTQGTTFPLTYVVTGGPGHFQGKSGSGTGSIVLSTPPPNIALTLTVTGNMNSQPGLKSSVNPSGIVPIGSSRLTIQPGSWLSIYGKNFAGTTTIWDGVSTNIPTNLEGITATLNGKPMYFWLRSPTQINLQAPDETLRGCATLTLNTPNGGVSSRVHINHAAPSLSLLDAKYPAVVIPTFRGGAYGKGTCDLAGPTGRFSYATRPAKKGEVVVLYGVGFGPTNPTVPAGFAFTGTAPVVSKFPVQVQIGGTTVTPAFVGLIGAGLYQSNITVPATAVSGDNPIRVSLPGADGFTQSNLFLAVQ